ncbi:MAG: TIR domain-containing protein [Candidatus Binatia bacterium]
MNEHRPHWDLFISHASEDKDTFVRPLAAALQGLGVSVWYDEYSLRLGDSLSRSIDRGLADSSFGLVVVSPAFIRKPWPEYELRGLVAREIMQDRVILPIWHGVTRTDVLAFSPPLCDKVALNTAGLSAEDVAIQILREVRPDLYTKHPRAQLQRIASGAALIDLQREIDRMREELASATEELKVTYTDESFLLSQLIDSFSPEAAARQALARKDKDWSYESEGRLITKSEHYPLTLPISRVIVGSRTNPALVSALYLMCVQAFRDHPGPYGGNRLGPLHRWHPTDAPVKLCGAKLCSCTRR